MKREFCEVLSALWRGDGSQSLRTPSTAAYSFHRLRTPSTAANSFHRLRRSPSLEEGGLGASRALSKLFIQPRVQGRNPARFNGGYGVPRGFKGEKSKSPPNPLGLAERVHRPQTMIPPRSPTPHSSCEFGFFFICIICFIYPKHMMFVSKTIRCPSGECRDSRHKNRFLPFRPCLSAAESPRPQGSSPFLKPCCRTAPRPRRFSECR